MSQPSVTDQVVLITGAAKRVGAGIARLLHAAGARVVIHCHTSRQAAEQLVAALNQQRSHSAAVVQGDLLQTALIPELIAAAQQQFGRLDVLCNNASTFYSTPFGTITATQWDDLVGTNLKAPLFLAQAAAPYLQQTQGLILNIADIHAQRPLPNYLVYSTAKAGLVMLTRALARELGPKVRVNGIAPGPILWPEQGMDVNLQQEIIDKTLLKRQGTVEDIARTVLFFVQAAPFVTGQILAVDGGRSVGW